jgi:hypothetical protein
LLATYHLYEGVICGFGTVMDNSNDVLSIDSAVWDLAGVF